ncbi:branched-chain amino acid ABC transporter permease [Candidatus Kaiserbacteria bacterium]|nr:branched-chain amino acid ABC transporter permease [Candidatus Kaiserbacteria bacterium]
MEYITHLAILFSIFAIFAVSLDLVAGYTGLISLAHAAFYGIGAYTTALLMADLGVNFFLAMLVGVLFSALIAFLIGLVFSRFKGDYYVLGTVGFTYIVFTIFLNWQSLTGGPLGIPGITRPAFFGFMFSDNLPFLLLSLAFLALVYGASRFIVLSPFGRVLRAIREDEEAVSVFGYRTLHYKLAIFVISAAMAALGGALLASYITFIDPQTFSLTESIFVLAIVVLGGLGSLRGPVLGALILILLPEVLRFVGFPSEIAAQMRQLMYGLILVLLMLYRPQGLLGEYKL